MTHSRSVFMVLARWVVLLVIVLSVAPVSLAAAAPTDSGPGSGGHRLAFDTPTDGSGGGRQVGLDAPTDEGGAGGGHSIVLDVPSDGGAGGNRIVLATPTDGGSGSRVVLATPTDGDGGSRVVVRLRVPHNARAKRDW